MTPKNQCIDVSIIFGNPQAIGGNAWLPGNGAAPWSQAASARNLELEAVWKLSRAYAKWIPMGIPMGIPMMFQWMFQWIRS
jgi:hypothetical protein